LTFFIGTGGSTGPILCFFIFDKSNTYQHLREINIVILAVMGVVALTLKTGKPFRAQ